MFKDNEILARISELEKQQTIIKNTLSVINDKMNALLELWDVPPIEKNIEEVAEWATILRKGEPTLCEVSTTGEVRFRDTKEPIRIHENATGKPRANIYWSEGGRRRNSTALIENLVARAFIDKDLPHRSSSVKHIDGDINNCRLDNLYVKRAVIQTKDAMGERI